MEKNVAGQKIFYVDHTWKELDALDRAKVKLILPVGSVEEHGPHMTVASDSKQAETFSLMAARQVPDSLVMPALWYTPSLDTARYTGTISIDYNAFINYMVEIFNSLYRHGFRKLLVANVHGGTKTVCDVAIREFHARMATPSRGYADDFFIHLHNLYSPALPFMQTMVEAKDWGHACEIESSVEMHLFPDRVDMTKATEDYIPWERGFEWYIGDMAAVSKSGIHGDARKATPEKGKKSADAILKAFVDILSRM